MFNIECCKGQRKCKVFELAKPKCFQHIYLKIGKCSKCKRLFCIIEKIDYFVPIDTWCPEHNKNPINLFCLDEKGKFKFIYKCKLI